MNISIIEGHLTKDPESRATQSGTPVATFTVAVNRKYKDANGAKQTDFIPVVAWRKTAELCAQYLRKGSHIIVAGSVQVRTYDAKDGTKRYAFEIVADEVQFLDSKQKEEKAEQIEGFTDITQEDSLPF